MPKKTTSSDASGASTKPSDAADASAQHIWLAGLGAMAKAQSQGTKAFEALISDGLAFQRKTQQAAQEKIHEATEQLSHLAKDFGQQSTGRIDRLEHLFEDRVARALSRLGIPSVADLQALSERIAALEAQLPQASRTVSDPPKSTRRPAAKKSR